MIASKRVECYSDTLLGIPLAQVHTGTNLDQTGVKVNVQNALALRILSALLGKAGVDQADTDENNDIEIPPTALDVGQAVLSGRSLIDTPIKKTIRKLLLLASEDSNCLYGIQ